jgi:hypothetical protein
MIGPRFYNNMQLLQDNANKALRRSWALPELRPMADRRRRKRHRQSLGDAREWPCGHR